MMDRMEFPLVIHGAMMSETGELDGALSAMSEDEFRTLLDACVDTLEGIGLPMTQESTERFDFDWMAVMEDYFAGPTSVGGGSSEPTP